jgi:hypothetical protein
MKAKSNMKFPDGNGKIGDEVWFRTAKTTRNGTRYGPWKKRFKIVKVGLMNESRYPLAIEIASKTQRVKTDPFGQRVIIFPQKEEYAGYPTLVSFLKENPDLRLIRLTNNSEIPTYLFLCTKCVGELHSYVETTESASIRWDPRLVNPETAPDVDGGTGFYEPELDQEDSHTTYICNCKDGVYDVPSLNRA